MKKYILVLVAISILGLWPFFKKGFFESHDGEWMVIRFTAFHQTLTAGQFPVRFVDRLNNNYGYPVLNFLYPLPFYLAEVPKLMGFGFVDSIKIVFIVSTMASVVAMFWALSLVFGRNAALAGSILYLFIPYRFVDLYVRGSIGENLAFAAVPLVAGCLIKVSQGTKIYLPLLSISVFLLILSHNVIALLFLPFFIFQSLLIIKRSRGQVILVFFLGILIATFFWLPAIYDLQFVRLSQIKVSEIPHHLASVYQLTIPSWGYGPNPNDGLSVQVGIVPLFIFLAAFYLYFKNKKKEPVIGFMLLIFIIIILLMLKPSQVFWQTIPFVDLIQFPWRLLSLVVFISAFLASYIISQIDQKSLIIIVIVASVISTITYTKPRTFVDKGDGFYATNEDTTTVRDEYLPLWVKEKPENRATSKIQIVGDGTIISQAAKPASYQAKIAAVENITVQVNTIYFPGWRAKVDSQIMPVNYQNRFGIITFDLPAGSHQVIIKYARTSVHLISEVISLAAIIATLNYFYLLWPKRNF